MNTTTVQLFAVTPDGPQPLPVPAGASHVHDLLDGLPTGIYTALATFDHNKFLLLGAHLDRLEKSLGLMGWDYRLDQKILRRALHEVVSAYPLPNARVRLDILARPVSIHDTESRLVIALSPFNPIPGTVYRDGVTAGISRGLSRSQPRVKMADFVLQRRSCFEDKAGIYEYLMLDDDGYILEGTTSNFFAFQDGVMRTAGRGVLEGVARRLVLEVAEALGIPYRLSPIHISAIPDLGEAALSSSSRALIPIVRIEDQPIGDGFPGPISRRLLEGYQKVVTQLIQPAYTEKHS